MSDRGGAGEPGGLGEHGETPSPAPEPDAQLESHPATLQDAELIARAVRDEAEQLAPAESSGEPVDPWAHRRGEPRIFAFLWTLYVLAAVAGSVLWTARLGSLSSGAYGPAARIMLVVIVIGACVLWPMTRLSQSSPSPTDTGATPQSGPTRAVLSDLMVVLLPVQLVLWPLLVLASWPWQTVAAVALLVVAWVLLVGGLLAIALTGRAIAEPADQRLWTRTAWMVAIVVLVLAAPALLLMHQVRGSAAPVWLPMLSPITAVRTLTGIGLMGPQRPVAPEEWRVLMVTLGLGGVCWLLAGVRGLLSRPLPRA